MKQGWEVNGFEDCLEKIVYTNKVQRKDFLIIGKYPIISQEQDFINGYWDNSADLFTVKKPIIIFGDHTQVLKYVDFDFVLGADGVKILQPKSIIYPRFFYYFLQSINLGSLGYARHYRLLKEIEVHFPKSLPEQQRIVAILDEAFAAIAQAKANAEQNLRNAKELFESYLQSVFENKGEGWEARRLDNIIESNVIGLTKNSSEQNIHHEFKYVKMNNITKGNCFDLSKYTCVNAEKSEIEKYRLSNDDFLFNTRNSYELVGKTCLFKSLDHEVILYNNNIMRIRFLKSINPYFINYAFSTDDVINKLDRIKSGTTNVSAIYYKDLRNLEILIPPLKKQEEIVQQLDALSTETKQLESIYQQKINDLDELKKSILQKAFAGELNTSALEV